MSQQRPSDWHEVFDYILVGAGSAGSVLANRLTASGKDSLCLLEAGGGDKKFWIQVPLGYGKTLFDPKVNWMYHTEPQSELQNREIYWPRGKVLGGSSSINALVYIRGQKADFDAWRDAGNLGWGYEDLLPYFKKLESRAFGDPDFRGKQGPVHISQVDKDMHPLVDNFLQAGQEMGFPLNPDFNGQKFEGVGRYHINTKNGRRMSAARAYLDPARHRKNLRIKTNSFALRILFDGRRATGIEYQHKGQTYRIGARKEIILSGGAVNSPQLLELSGVGSGELLQNLGIKPILNQPHVGENLRDHIGLDYVFLSKVPTLNNKLNPWYGKLWEGFKYLTARRGTLALSINQAGGFVKSSPERAHANVQLYFWPFSYTKAPARSRPIMTPDPFPAFEIGVQPCKPKSKGALHIVSPDPHQAPKIDPRYLSAEEDKQEMLEAVSLIRQFAAQPALKTCVERELLPGTEIKSTEEAWPYITSALSTIFHPVSTCRMGPDARNHVVDPSLKVHGLHSLRVVDASVFPDITSGNTNAPTMALAEKAADLIIQDRH